MIDVTVVIPTHNRLRLLRAAIAAVLNQEAVSLEVVVVNDGSTDGTSTWLDRRAAQDARIKVVHHERPKLMSAARNAGIAHASARWVAFCDDDDLWAPDKLVSQLRALSSNAAGWACTGLVAVNDGLEIIGHHRVRGGQVLSELLQENTIPSGSSVIADLNLIRRVGGFDPTLQGSEDWDLWIRLAQHSQLVAVDRPLLAYRLGLSSMSMDVERMRTGRAIIVDRYAPIAAQQGVSSTEVTHERYLAKQLLRAGSGQGAASIFASLVVKHRLWRELPRVPAALIAPRWTDRLGTARAAAAVPADWKNEAEDWLRSMRTAGERTRPDHRGWHDNQRSGTLQ
ncbi:glycosyltransferase involved in cell wall biosynthesis [Bradyrhizobium sp. USDA 4474]